MSEQTIMRVKGYLRTSGRGLWSSAKRRVQVRKITLDAFAYGDEEPFVGELRVYFYTKSWDVRRLGLIYTDPTFQRELRKVLRAWGFKHVKDVGYSEQGMQGTNYVSFDASDDFLASVMKRDPKFKVERVSHAIR